MQSRKLIFNVQVCQVILAAAISRMGRGVENKEQGRTFHLGNSLLASHLGFPQWEEQVQYLRMILCTQDFSAPRPIPKKWLADQSENIYTAGKSDRDMTFRCHSGLR